MDSSIPSCPGAAPPQLNLASKLEVCTLSNLPLRILGDTAVLGVSICDMDILVDSSGENNGSFMRSGGLAADGGLVSVA